ncbi:uncharacterized protein [Solanum tuberosum]|uniref:Uncharacterized protein n=2 Tax=Solanum TaxID=4107 RepID=M1BTK2_SOLTU|nr:PREDICTED: uncharacterized protein LOC107061619 [Solanum tuberosum]
MEGLIPLVCKTFKRNKTIRKYKSLSSETNNINNIEDFYPEYTNRKDYDYGVENYPEYRRTQSVRAPEKSVYYTQKDKQLVRFTSHRMFSCVTGA